MKVFGEVFVNDGVQMPGELARRQGIWNRRRRDDQVIERLRAGSGRAASNNGHVGAPTRPAK